LQRSLSTGFLEGLRIPDANEFVAGLGAIPALEKYLKWWDDNQETEKVSVKKGQTHYIR
jgi:hypothetical protein